jgi:3-phytase
VVIGDTVIAAFGDSLGAIEDLEAYRQADGTRALIAAIPSRDMLVIIDAATGRIIRTVGTRGSGMGQLRGPVSVVVIGDSIVLVAERGNRRVQGFQLPAFTTVGTFGERVFREPAAVDAHRDGDAHLVSVTENPDTVDAAAGPERGPRLQQFRVTVANGELVAVHWRSPTLGAAETAGAILSDAAHDRLFVVLGTITGDVVRVHELNGRFTGQSLTADNAASTIEDLAMNTCGDDGYLLIAARAGSNTAVHVFDRRSLAYHGFFRSAAAALSAPLSVSGEPAAPVIVTSSRDSLRRSSLTEVASKLGLPTDCAAR